MKPALICTALSLTVRSLTQQGSQGERGHSVKVATNMKRPLKTIASVVLSRLWRSWEFYGFHELAVRRYRCRSFVRSLQQEAEVFIHPVDYPRR